MKSISAILLLVLSVISLANLGKSYHCRIGLDLNDCANGSCGGIEGIPFHICRCKPGWTGNTIYGCFSDGALIADNCTIGK
jgi:hypothetical protein